MRLAIFHFYVKFEWVLGWYIERVSEVVCGCNGAELLEAMRFVVPVCLTDLSRGSAVGCVELYPSFVIECSSINEFSW